MLLTIDNILSPEEIAAARAFMVQGEFLDGKLSAGKMAQSVKNNQELNQSSDIFKRLNAVVFERLIKHPEFQAAALPNKMAAPYYSKYSKGMQYGAHVDDPLMGSGPYLRTDVSATLFLSDPEAYQGGELCVMTDFGEQRVKLQAGSVVIYASSSLHRVIEITEGERLALVVWLQSCVREPAQREILYRLWQSRESLLVANPKGADTRRIDRVYANLVRMWADV
ncbi:MAG: Fe2+-dependent dioxygenase [Arenicellales bacterium]